MISNQMNVYSFMFRTELNFHMIVTVCYLIGV
jgi:hypothetical protein